MVRMKTLEWTLPAVKSPYTRDDFLDDLRVLRLGQGDLGAIMPWSTQSIYGWGGRAHKIPPWVPHLLAAWIELRKREETNGYQFDPEIRGGVPVVRGTRFTVSQVLAELAELNGVAELSEEFDLNIEAVRAMLREVSLIFQQPCRK